jgi:hypothetical protein
MCGTRFPTFFAHSYATIAGMTQQFTRHTRDCWESRRSQLPLHAAISEEILDRSCAVLGHRMCGYGWGEFAWAVPAGWPTFDGDGQLDNPIPDFVIAGWNRIRYQLVDRFDRSGPTRGTDRHEATADASPSRQFLDERIAN